MSEPQEVADILDGLTDPTADEVYQEVREYDTRHVLAAGISHGGGGGGGGSTPVRCAYFGVGVFIGNGVGALLTWDTLDFGTELLDRAAPDQPVVLADGLYALNATYASDAPITAGGFVQPTVAGGPISIVGSPATIVHFGVEMTALLLMTAGDTLTFYVQNHEGADGSTFNLSNTTLIKIS